MVSIAVISDTHFGLDRSTLSNSDSVGQLIWEIWKFGGGCDEVVLLGDIFDFWRVRPEKALRDSVFFFRRLSDLDLRVRYVVGNHDHHLAVMHQENELLERVARGDLFSIYSPNLRWSQRINGQSIEMFYPTYCTRCRSRSVMFSHGHHLDGLESFSIQLIEQLRRLSGEDLSPSDLEMMMTYAYESIYRSSYIGEMVELEERLWKVSSFFYRFKASVLKTLRFTPIERQYEAIIRFIREQNGGRADLFVYGDTHRPDLYQRPGGPVAVNTGCFLAEENAGCRKETRDTYLIMNENGVFLRQLGRVDPLCCREYA
ncbi:MAG: UDP-2,3-diacylglucosamine diphosphatase [Methanotrichaceae archaeon]|nr:UDP-2,3-diacylglucosamine diphosphatase [Methanotrichaceae archaeon]